MKFFNQKGVAGFIPVVIIVLLLTGLVVGVYLVRQKTNIKPQAAEPASDPTLHHILVTGQSLSRGAYGEPPLSISQPFDNLMLINDSYSALIEGPNFCPGTALGLGCESPASAMANTITNLMNGKYRSVVTLHGVSGAPYSELKKGTQAYANGLHQVEVANASAKYFNVPLFFRLNKDNN